MIDIEKINQAEELIKESGAETVVLIVNDGEYQVSLINGGGGHIVRCLHALMKKDVLFAYLVKDALKSYLIEMEEGEK